MPAVAALDTANNRVRLTIDYPSGTSYWVTRTGGGTTEEVRSAYPTTNVSGGHSVVDDYEVPRDVPVTYTVNVNFEGSTVKLTSNSVTYPSNGQVWLIHPGQPSLSRRVEVAIQDEEVYGTTIEVFQAINGTGAVSWSSPMMSLETTLQLRTATKADRDALKALIKLGQPLFIAAPADYIEPGYMGITGLSIARVNPGMPTDQERLWTINFIYVLRPSGYLVQMWSFEALGAAYSTLAAVDAAYATNNDILFNNPITP